MLHMTDYSSKTFSGNIFSQIELVLSHVRAVVLASLRKAAKLFWRFFVPLFSFLWAILEIFVLPSSRSSGAGAVRPPIHPQDL